jgi:catechol 2,3-dioxygenase-like lactoylglutathione lyase family enzyme
MFIYGDPKTSLSRRMFGFKITSEYKSDFCSLKKERNNNFPPNEWRMIMKIALTSLFVDDPVKAHEFYTEVLGFETKEFAPDDHLAIVVSPEDPKGTALLLEPRGDSFAKTYQENVYNAGLPIIVFSSDNVEAVRKDLESRGVKFRDDLAKPE